MLGHPLMLFLGLALTFGGCVSSAGGAFGLGLIFLLIALVLWIFGMSNAYHTAERINQGS
jgi:hypothetical protein